MAAIDSDTLFPEPRPKEAPFLYRLSRRFEEYLNLMRLNRPIGIWLLMWPALWALWIASSGRPSAFTSLAKRPSLPPPITIQSSDARKAWYGTMPDTPEPCAPMRRGEMMTLASCMHV